MTEPFSIPPPDPREPSDLALDRLKAGELDPVERAAVEAAIARSPAARARWEARQRGFPEGVGVDALLARIQAKAEGATPGPAVEGLLARMAGGAERPRLKPLPWWRRWRLPELGLLAATAAAVFLVARPVAPVGGDGGDLIRPKGGLALDVYRKTATGSELVAPGVALRSGDKLRFEVTTPRAGELAVFDLDPSGAVSLAWPLEGEARSRAVPAGKQQLSGAVELDEAVGPESLHAVWCERGFGPDDVKVGVTAGTLVAPAGCSVTPFSFVKVAP